jgi:archaellum component FlaC
MPKASPSRDKSKKSNSLHEIGKSLSDLRARVERIETEIPLHGTDSLLAPLQKSQAERELKQGADESIEQRMRRIASLEEEFPHLSM